MGLTARPSSKPRCWRPMRPTASGGERPRATAADLPWSISIGRRSLPDRGSRHRLRASAPGQRLSLPWPAAPDGRHPSPRSHHPGADCRSYGRRPADQCRSHRALPGYRRVDHRSPADWRTQPDRRGVAIAPRHRGWFSRRPEQPPHYACRSTALWPAICSAGSTRRAWGWASEPSRSRRWRKSRCWRRRSMCGLGPSTPGW